MGEWLLEKLNAKGRGARVALAKAMGVNPEMITRITNGERRVKASEIPAIQHFFGEPIPSLALVESIQDLDEPSIISIDDAERFEGDTNQVPHGASSGEIYRGAHIGVIPEIDAAAGAGNGQVGEIVTVQSSGIRSGHRVTGEWQIPPEITRHHMGADPRQVLILPVRGDSMEPTLRPGDRVMVDLTDTIPNDGGIFVLDEGNGPLVKRIRLKPGTSPAMIEVISDNAYVGKYELAADQVRVIGRVRGKWTAI